MNVCYRGKIPLAEKYAEVRDRSDPRLACECYPCQRLWGVQRVDPVYLLFTKEAALVGHPDVSHKSVLGRPPKKERNPCLVLLNKGILNTFVGNAYKNVWLEVGLEATETWNMLSPGTPVSSEAHISPGWCH